MNSEKNDTQEKPDFDGAWKAVLDLYLEQFTELCWPEAFVAIDWTRKYTPLDKELLKIEKEGDIGNRYPDKLFSVWLKDGTESLALLHLEVQRSHKKEEFLERMNTYRYRLQEKYGKSVASLVILIDRDHKWRPNRYHHAFLGSETIVTFPILKILDYKGKESILKESGNPFACIILAQLREIVTSNQDEARLTSKLEVTRLLYKQGFKREDAYHIFQFMDLALTLKPVFAVKYVEEVRKLEKEVQAVENYVTSVERIGIEKGLQQGILQGIQQGVERGKQEGRREGERVVLIALLEKRFTLTPSYRARLEQADEASMMRITDKIWYARSLDDLFSNEA